MKNRISIGTASIILIFIILCLAVFSLLGLSDGKSAEIFAKRYADSVNAYYQADSLGQIFIRDVRNGILDGQTLEDAGDLALAELPAGSTAEIVEAGMGGDGGAEYLVCEIPMNAGQALHIELKDNADFIAAYYVYNKEDYAIDNRVPVWTGTED